MEEEEEEEAEEGSEPLGTPRRLPVNFVELLQLEGPKRLSLSLLNLKCFAANPANSSCPRRS